MASVFSQCQGHLDSVQIFQLLAQWWLLKRCGLIRGHREAGEISLGEITGQSGLEEHSKDENVPTLTHCTPLSRDHLHSGVRAKAGVYVGETLSSESGVNRELGLGIGSLRIPRPWRQWRSSPELCG